MITKYGFSVSIEDIEKNIKRLTNQLWKLIPMRENEEDWKRQLDNFDGGMQDICIVTTHMMLEVTDLGLGSTWVGAFDPFKAREIYNVPENYEIAAILPVGYPSEEAHPSRFHNDRKAINEIAFYNKF